MRPRLVLSPDDGLTPERHGLASRVTGAIVCFLVGAIAATELYPQMVADRHSEYARVSPSERAASPSTLPDAISSKAGVFSLRDSAERTGGPIPPVPFGESPPQTTGGTRIAANEAPSASAVSAEKPRRTESKSVRIKHSSHRSNGNTQDQPYREQSTSWTATTGWNPWTGSQSGFGFGPRQDRGTQVDRRGQFAMWRWRT
jgi:hypothetical protein